MGDWSKGWFILLHQDTHNPTPWPIQVICASVSIYTCTSVCLLCVDPPTTWKLLQFVLQSRSHGGVRRDVALMQMYKSALTERCRLIYQFFLVSPFSLSVLVWISKANIYPQKNCSIRNDARTLWANSKTCAQSRQHVLYLKIKLCLDSTDRCSVHQLRWGLVVRLGSVEEKQSAKCVSVLLRPATSCTFLTGLKVQGERHGATWIA